MKKILPLVLLSCLLLSSCIATPPTGNSPTVTDVPSPSQQVTLDAAQARLEYYEALVARLQQELLELKTQAYQTSVEYEALLEELKGMGQGREETEENFVYVIQNGRATVTAYRGSRAEVVVPASLGGVPVTAIADRAFENHTALISVTLPEGVTELGWFAFAGCISLTRVTLPASVTCIYYGAFENCNTALTLSCPAQSYVHRYAQSYGLPTVHP